MKKYIQPITTVVRIQHQGLLMQSTVTSASSGDTGISYGGASSNNGGGEIRTKESSGVWDEEW